MYLKKKLKRDPPFNLAKLQKYLVDNLIISHMYIMANGSGLASADCPFSTLIQNEAGALDSNYSPDAESDVVSINLQSAAGLKYRGFFSVVLQGESQKMTSQMIHITLYYSLSCHFSLNLNGFCLLPILWALPRTNSLSLWWGMTPK